MNRYLYPVYRAVWMQYFLYRIVCYFLIWVLDISRNTPVFIASSKTIIVIVPRLLFSSSPVGGRGENTPFDAPPPSAPLTDACKRGFAPQCFSMKCFVILFLAVTLCPECFIAVGSGMDCTCYPSVVFATEFISEQFTSRLLL